MGSILSKSFLDLYKNYWISAEVLKCSPSVSEYYHVNASLIEINLRKLTKRLEDLTQDSAALKSHLVPQLRALNNVVPELVNFGISVSSFLCPSSVD